MNWKHYITGAIISSECYEKLPTQDKKNYRPVYEEVTHRYEEDSTDEGLGIIAAIVAMSSFDGGDSSSVDTPSDNGSNDFGGFGGGDSGGGGASGDY